MLNTKPEIVAHPLRFHGHEGQYFRIWIVNVLLGVLTLGLYTPWARRRTVQYFYQSTEMADGAFEFTAPIRRMLVGFLLFGGLYLALNLAGGSDDPLARALGNALLALAVLAAPWLWASAMRFRLRHTRWRGLRLNFAPSAKSLYLASWPMLALAVLFGCLAMAALSIYFYWKWQTRGSKKLRLGLATARGALLSLLLVVLAEPILVLRLTSSPRPLLWVLVDGSDSMAIKDELSPTDRSRLERAVGLSAAASGDDSAAAAGAGVQEPAREGTVEPLEEARQYPAVGRDLLGQ